jgi:hypothetical protein
MATKTSKSINLAYKFIFIAVSGIAQESEADGFRNAEGHLRDSTKRRVTQPIADCRSDIWPETVLTINLHLYGYVIHIV